MTHVISEGMVTRRPLTCTQPQKPGLLVTEASSLPPLHRPSVSAAKNGGGTLQHHHPYLESDMMQLEICRRTTGHGHGHRRWTAMLLCRSDSLLASVRHTCIMPMGVPDKQKHTSASLCSFRYAMATSAPSRAYASATALPMPLSAPVIKAFCRREEAQGGRGQRQGEYNRQRLEGCRMSIPSIEATQARKDLAASTTLKGQCTNSDGSRTTFPARRLYPL